jgi:hypothetical protein
MSPEHPPQIFDAFSTLRFRCMAPVHQQTWSSRRNPLRRRQQSNVLLGTILRYAAQCRLELRSASQTKRPPLVCPSTDSGNLAPCTRSGGRNLRNFQSDEANLLHKTEPSDSRDCAIKNEVLFNSNSPCQIAPGSKPCTYSGSLVERIRRA